jgi:hypothetical protein
MVRFAALLALLAALAPAQVRIVGVEDWGWSSGAEHTRVKGRIVDAHGASLAGAGVRLRAALSAKTTLYETRTGADGDFEFPDGFRRADRSRRRSAGRMAADEL